MLTDLDEYKGLIDSLVIIVPEDLPEKEHDCARIIQLVHLVEIWHFCDVHKINDRKILHLREHVILGTCNKQNTQLFPKHWRNDRSQNIFIHQIPADLSCSRSARWLNIRTLKYLFGDAVQHFIHLHTRRVPIVAKSYNNRTVFL